MKTLQIILPNYYLDLVRIFKKNVHHLVKILKQGSI